MFYNIITGIKNIFRWLPVIWKDRQWDQDYLYRVIGQKLKLMEEFWYSDDPWSANQEKVAKKVKLCRLLCDRIVNHDYLMNVLIPVEKKYGELKMYFEKTDNPNLQRMVFNETPEERKAHLRAYHHSDYMEKQDKKMFFNILQKHIDKFWD